jgi:hypothetical protein
MKTEPSDSHPRATASASGAVTAPGHAHTALMAWATQAGPAVQGRGPVSAHALFSIFSFSNFLFRFNFQEIRSISENS